MNKTLIATLVALLFLTGGALTAVSADDSNADSSVTVTDSVGRTVTVPSSFEGGIITYGWWVAQVVSFFDAHKYVTEVDAAEIGSQYGSLQPHAFVYDTSKLKTHIDETFSAAQAEQDASDGVSLVITRDEMYTKYQTEFDSLNEKVPVLVVSILSFYGDGYSTGSDGKYHLAADVCNTLSILGDAFGEFDRDEEVISAIDATLADIQSNKVTSSLRFNLSGSEMAMCGGNLNIVFTWWSAYNMAGATNAASGYADRAVMNCYYDLTVEGFTNPSYSFDVLLYDPSNPGNLGNTNNQTILNYLYSKQGTDDGVKIYTVLTTALVGFNLFNSMYNAYFLEHLMGSSTVTMDYATEKMTEMYKVLWGDDAGSKIADGLASLTLKRGSDNGEYTVLWEELQIQNDGGTYKLVKAGSSDSNSSDSDSSDDDDSTALYIGIAAVVIIIIAALGYYLLRRRA